MDSRNSARPFSLVIFATILTMKNLFRQIEKVEDGRTEQPRRDGKQPPTLTGI